MNYWQDSTQYLFNKMIDYNLPKLAHIIFNIADIDLEHTNCFGQTALHRAIEAEHFKMVELLLNQGANPQTRDANGNTALHLSVIDDNFKTSKSYSKTQIKIIKLLIDANVDPSSKNRQGKTIIHLVADAAVSGDIQILQLILTKNINLEVKDNDGNTPISCLVNTLINDQQVSNNQLAVIECLVAFGAVINNNSLNIIDNKQTELGELVSDKLAKAAAKSRINPFSCKSFLNSVQLANLNNYSRNKYDREELLPSLINALNEQAININNQNFQQTELLRRSMIKEQTISL